MSSWDPPPALTVVAVPLAIAAGGLLIGLAQLAGLVA